MNIKYIYDELTANYFRIAPNRDYSFYYVQCSEDLPKDDTEDTWTDCEFIYEHQVELIEKNLGKITQNIWVAESIEKDEINFRYLFDN